MTMLLLMLSGAAGAVSRYMLGLLLTRRLTGKVVPLPALTVNILGSLGLGIFLGLYFKSIPLEGETSLWFLTTGTGFFGAFTTFSTFAVEAVLLLKNKDWMPFLWYTALTIVGSLTAFIFGFLAFSSS
ncbi:fluoride efflux transporter FluC [Alkalicoccus halolimnae]|uniref:Fluoride-specific ion channel FluC n=1 Tax=Alkalicoccus halolimnae TaxID=1667239 RepID=A0A5C7FCS4_9BACI|nr:CrcB family protein [Alkalicoccus halolimnae]TXF82294.1 CrcB family protein [Alkalicoccus halolimnae]